MTIKTFENKVAINKFNWFKVFVRNLFVLFLMCVFLGACDDKKSEEKIAEKQNSDPKNVCDLVNDKDVSDIMDVKVDYHKNVTQMISSDGKRFVSQCSYYIENRKKFIGIYVRYSANESVPKNVDQFVALAGSGDKETESKISAAVKKATMINDLGGFGIWYQVYAGTPSLALYYNDHYEIIFSAYGFKFDEETMNKAKQLVKLIKEKI